MATQHWHTIRTPESVLSLLRARRPIADAKCTHGGCGNPEVFRCAYRDREGMRCTTYWCGEHVEFMDGAPFCHRHAAVMRILVPTQGTLVEMKTLPLVDDRALTLANTLAGAIGEGVMDLLRERFKDDPVVRFAEDLVPREHTPRQVRPSWERGWTCYDHRGYRTRVCVRVPVQTSIVQLVLNDIPLLTVAAPRRGEHEAFETDLVRTLRAALFAPDEEDSDELPAAADAAIRHTVNNLLMASGS